MPRPCNTPLRMLHTPHNSAHSSRCCTQPTMLHTPHNSAHSSQCCIHLTTVHTAHNAAYSSQQCTHDAPHSSQQCCIQLTTVHTAHNAAHSLSIRSWGRHLTSTIWLHNVPLLAEALFIKLSSARIHGAHKVPNSAISVLCSAISVLCGVS